MTDLKYPYGFHLQGSTKVIPSVPERRSSLELSEEEMEQDPEDNRDLDILDITENFDVIDID